MSTSKSLPSSPGSRSHRSHQRDWTQHSRYQRFPIYPVRRPTGLVARPSSPPHPYLHHLSDARAPTASRSFDTPLTKIRTTSTMQRVMGLILNILVQHLASLFPGKRNIQTTGHCTPPLLHLLLLRTQQPAKQWSRPWACFVWHHGLWRAPPFGLERGPQPS